VENVLRFDDALHYTIYTIHTVLYYGYYTYCTILYYTQSSSQWKMYSDLTMLYALYILLLHTFTTYFYYILLLHTQSSSQWKMYSDLTMLYALSMEKSCPMRFEKQKQLSNKNNYQQKQLSNKNNYQKQKQLSDIVIFFLHV